VLYENDTKYKILALRYFLQISFTFFPSHQIFLTRYKKMVEEKGLISTVTGFSMNFSGTNNQQRIVKYRMG